MNTLTKTERRAREAVKLLNRSMEAATPENVAEAIKLYNSVIRYVNAAARHWEKENTSEHYANSKACAAAKEKLEKRRIALAGRLKFYGLQLDRSGLYPQLAEAGDPRRAADVYLIY